MDEIGLLIDLHADGERQGPGSPAATRRAIELAGLDPSKPLAIADLGSGTGAAALLLAGDLDAKVTAVDFSEDFLRVLEQRAERLGISDSIDTRVASIDDLPFEEAALDVVWSEGAIYNIGFERGIQYWRRYLKRDGVLAVSEITWLSGERPHEIDQFWRRAYPEIDTASAKFRLLERHGYAPIGYFVLSSGCWTTNYYEPLERRYEAFLERQRHSGSAVALVEADRREAELYRRFADFYSYGFYIARRVD